MESSLCSEKPFQTHSTRSLHSTSGSACFSGLVYLPSPVFCELNELKGPLWNVYLTLSSSRSDGFLPPTWTKKECSRQRTLTLLPLNQEPSSIYCSQRKLLTLSRKTTTTNNKKNVFAVAFSGFFQPVFQLCIFNYASALLLFALVVGFFFFSNDVLFNCCTGTMRREKKKQQQQLACGLSACACSAEAARHRRTVDSFTLKKAPLCCSSMRGDIIVQYR